LDVSVGGSTGTVTITPPSTDYVVSDGAVEILGYLVRVETNSFTDHNLGYDGTLEQTIVVPSSTYTVYGISLGTEGNEHPESDPVECSIVTPSPTLSPTPANTQYEVPTLASCEVLVNQEEINDDVVVTISWVKGNQYQHNAADVDLYGYKYKLGGTSSWTEVVGESTLTIEALWPKSYAEAQPDTYMLTIGQETIGGILEYPESSSIPCDLVTLDPTSYPTISPSTVPTFYPSRVPTGSPTFEEPEVSFVATNVLTGEILYNGQEGNDDGIEITVALNPAPLFPIPVNWEILDSDNQPITEGFNETSGVVSFGSYRTNYKTQSPGCSEEDGECIVNYECIPHMGSDYCVKVVGTVYAKIYLFAYDDSTPDEDPEIFRIVFSPSMYYSDNEFYENSSHYSIHPQDNNATIVIYDANSQAFCQAVPGSTSCIIGGSQFLEPWHYLVMVLLVLALLGSIFYARKKAIAARRAKRQRQIAQEALKNEVLIQEDGFGAALTVQMNPLARTDTGREVKPIIEARVSDEEEEAVDLGFSPNKQQFHPQEVNESWAL